MAVVDNITERLVEGAALAASGLGGGRVHGHDPAQRRGAAVVLLAVGGTLFRIGAVIYGLRRPNP
jgi:hypothetical protein